MAADEQASNEELVAEIRALRLEVERLRVKQSPPRLFPGRDQHGKIRLVIHTLETDPDTQYKVHRWGCVYWLINFPIIIWLFFWHQDIWIKVGVFITLIYSIYANLATDYGAMSSAMAAKGLRQPPEIPLEDRD